MSKRLRLSNLDNVFLKKLYHAIICCTDIFFLHKRYWCGIVVFTVFAIQSGLAQTPVIVTDKNDYKPTETVFVNGTGWQGGESIRLIFNEVPLQPADTFYVTADFNGSFNNFQTILVDKNDIDAFFTLYATGMTSGYSTLTTFTDKADCD